jgi:hypothetical protein
MPQRSDQELVSWEIIGAEMGMTGEGARQIYDKALAKMREYLRENPARLKAAHNLLVDREPRHYGDKVDPDSECEKC